MGLLEHFLVAEREELMDNDVRLLSIGRIAGAARRRSGRALARDRGADARQPRPEALPRPQLRRAPASSPTPRAAWPRTRGRVASTSTTSTARRLEQALAARLYQPDMPPHRPPGPHGGRERLSNFLLWQMAYGEIWITDVCWPEFREEELEAALAAFATRERRFGGLIQKVGS